ncbi:MAG TPA: MFS transporter [Candidatus Limnocylindrales bacterium]|nr:MFS transporter [Candidatus Limnocylindrales bacterium]
MEALRVYRGLLANRPLTKLLIGEFISGIGDWLYIVAIFVVIYRETNDAAIVGLFGAVRLLPYIVLSVPAGVVADRFDRRLVLLTSDLVRAAVMILMTWIVATDGPILAVVLLAMVAASGSTFFYPAMGAYLPSLAADERQLGPANSAWASLGNISFILGPAIGGILVAAGDITLAFILNALSFLVVAAILWTLPPSIPKHEPAPAEGDAEAEAEPADIPPDDGLVPEQAPASRFPWRRFSGLLLIQSIEGFFDGGIQSATIVIAVTILNAGEEANGFLNAAIGVGGLVGAVVSSVLVLRRHLSGPLVAGAALTAVGAALLGGVPVLTVALFAIGLTAAGSIVLDVVLETTFQRVVPDELRGRGLGLMISLSTISAAAGAFLLPILLIAVGPLAALGLSGLAILLATFVALGLLGGALTRDPSPFEATIARVARLPLFAGVPASRLEAALGHVRPVEVEPGQIIVREGDRADRFYIIETGSFTVSQTDESGEPSILRRLGPDEVFGEIGLLNRVPRSATVTADTAGTLLEMDGDDFLRLVGASPDVRARLLGLYGGATTARSA